ncbi:MAG: hypothetical protein WCR76_07510 [Sphaerochaetaceae bacterium]
MLFLYVVIVRRYHQWAEGAYRPKKGVGGPEATPVTKSKRTVAERIIGCCHARREWENGGQFRAIYDFG